MTDDIKAIRDALAAHKAAQTKHEHPPLIIYSPERISRLLDALEAATRDAERYQWMKREVKRIPPGWGLIGWDNAIDAAMSAAHQSPPADRAAGESVSNPQR